MKQLKLVAYCNSRWSVGDEMVNGQRKLEYGAWNAEYLPPPLSAVERSPTRNQEAPPEVFVAVLWRQDGEIARYKTRAGRNVDFPMRSGMRTLTGVQLNTKSGDYRVLFTCACKRRDHISSSGWRKANAGSGCRECRSAIKRGAMVQIPREGWQARVERERRHLLSNPMTVGTPPAARGGKHMWMTGR